MYNTISIWVEQQKQRILQSKAEASEAEVLEQLQQKVKSELKIDYLVTGSWSLKASQEAVRLLGPDYVNVASDARKANDGKFGKIPDESTWNLSEKPAMVYLCENETVDGVEFPAFPKVLESKASNDGTIVVGDFSSTILSRRIPFEYFSIVFFGAQKNLGSTGITPVIVRKDLVSLLTGKNTPELIRKLGLPVPPTILDYSVIAKNNSLYNTLSIFEYVSSLLKQALFGHQLTHNVHSVFVAGQVLKKLLASFPDKVHGQEAVAGRKSALLYGALDAYPEIYKVVPDKNARSRMNICFRVAKVDRPLSSNHVGIRNKVN